MKLYYSPQDYKSTKILIAAQYNGVEFESCDEKSFQKHQNLHPFAKLPCLETSKGLIFQSNAILHFITNLRPEINLSGSSLYEKAKIDEWIDHCANEIEPTRNICVYVLKKWIKTDKKTFLKAKSDLEKNLQILDDFLVKKTFFVGETITLADIVIGTLFLDLFKLILDKKYREKYANLTRWFNTLINQEEWKKIIGSDFVFCDKDLSTNKLLFENSVKCEKKPVKTNQNKQEKKPVSTSNKKVKNVLDQLPPSEMDLDTVKRIFSNNPFDKAFELFMENWDPDGYSMFVSKYKYNDENTIDFQTSNLVSGWMQRLESAKKYAFGCINIYGVEDSKGPFIINGAWVFRGPGIPEEFSTCPDSDCHEMIKIEINNSEDKKLFMDFCGGNDSFGSVPLYERKQFK